MSEDRISNHGERPDADSMRSAAPHGATPSVAEVLYRNGDNLNRFLMACSDVYNERFADTMEAGGLWGRFVGELGEAGYATFNDAYIRIARLGRQAADCRTPADVAKFEADSVKYLTEVSESVAKSYAKAWTGLSRNMTPLIHRAAAAPERIAGTLSR